MNHEHDCLVGSRILLLLLLIYILSNLRNYFNSIVCGEAGSLKESQTWQSLRGPET